MTRSQVAREVQRMHGPVPPPLWLRALFEREVDKAADRLDVRREEIFGGPRTSEFAAERRAIAQRLHAIYPHTWILARAMRVNIESLRTWLGKGRRDQGEAA